MNPPDAQPAKEPVVPPIEQPIQEPVQNPVQQPIQQPIQEPVQNPVQPPIEQPIQPVENPAQKPVRKPAKKAAKNRVWKLTHGPKPYDGVFIAVQSILQIAVCALLIVTFVVQPMRIPSDSMEPTLRVGDFLLVDMQSFAPSGVLDRMLLPQTRVERGDLAVFHYPVDRSMDLVKRVVGVPGDRIRLHDGRVLIDGRPVSEPYAFFSPSRPNGFRDDFPSLMAADPNVDLLWRLELRQLTLGSGEVLIPPGEYFVLGDNRNDSEDSRYWGFVPRSAMVGRPLLVYFTSPLAKDRSADSPLTHLRRELKIGVHSWRVLR